MLKSILVQHNITIGLLFVCISATNFFPQVSLEQKNHPDKNYPRWLMNDEYHPSQTSGIIFLRQLDDGTHEFLIADDIGDIHRIFIKDDTIFTFRKIEFSPEVIEYLKDFPKPDFEEILYDKFTRNIYITIEGNGKKHRLYHGIYKLNFKNDDVYQDSVISIEKLNIQPPEQFYSELNLNNGYEGLAVDENYFYMGLEAVLTSKKAFSGHTLIRIADKKSLQIVREISTDTLSIATIGGLCSDTNFSLFGIDRNQRKVFKLKLDEYLNVVEINSFGISTVIPNHQPVEYTASLVSITITPDHKIFMVDDPWYEKFIPSEEILNKLDKRTIENFKNFIPIIYKYNIE
jgi:hypothetical protein